MTAKGENEDGLREEIVLLREQKDSIENMLRTLTNMHRNLLDKLTTSSVIEQRYVKMLSIYQCFGRISPSIFP